MFWLRPLFDFLLAIQRDCDFKGISEMKKFTTYFMAAVAALFCGSAALPVLAQEGSTITPQAPTVTPIVDTAGLQTTLVTNLQSWVIIGLSVGIILLVVFLGWKWIRRFMGR